MTSAADCEFDRRALSRALSKVANASPREILLGKEIAEGSGARRIGITGPAGAGKSSLIGRLLPLRLERPVRIAVIAIDPSSPRSQGSVLGDRLRMDAQFDHPRLYIRSFPSRNSHDGLTNNLPEILATLDQFGFDEVIVETVGVGQAEYGIRAFVDTEVLVLVPDAGDHVQAMKCGILETADVYVVNKSDLPGAERIASEVQGVLQVSAGMADSPPVLLTHRGNGGGITAVDEAIQAHLESAVASRDEVAIQGLRRQLRVQHLIARQVAELTQDLAGDDCDRSLRELYHETLRRLVSSTV